MTTNQRKAIAWANSLDSTTAATALAARLAKVESLRSEPSRTGDARKSITAERNKLLVSIVRVWTRAGKPGVSV